MKMWYYLMVVIDGVKQFITTLWELQEMRFSAIFDDLSYITMTIITAAVSCIIHQHHQHLSS
ncbi:hypothetical protein KY290_003073 [Solanum tuberosum]|uniref:Uncharacterized protein n=1 Tax=Solanum tuberosum TaxID=4113 RepID=A0ABQ7WRX1_SOLTU|nr:hypothetical protein KY285_003041 [Solanum tuberosum]KAH0783475.1 hypothetical protein KY290_003073 [Solanum tuberosum]